MADHKRREANGQRANYGIARRYLRMILHMTRFGHIYLPPDLRIGAACEARGERYQMIWPYLIPTSKVTLCCSRQPENSGGIVTKWLQT